MFEGLFRVVTWILGQFYAFTHSYGVSIILLTILVMIVTAPLTLKSTRSMLQMQLHQPEMKRIQTQYKDDRERLNQELMALYKEHGINPLSGCVPMLIQAPVFLILYQVLRGLTERAGGTTSAVGRVVGSTLSGVSTGKWVQTDQVFRPKHLATSSELYKALSGTYKMPFFGVDLSITPLQALQKGMVVFLPFLALMIGMFVSQYIQNRQIQGRNPNAGAMNPQQQMIMKFLPFMLPVFSINFPAGLALYYFVQGLCRIGLQGYITRAVYGPHQELKAQKEAEAQANAAKIAKSSQKDRQTATSSQKSTPKPTGRASGGSTRKSGAPRAANAPRRSGSSKKG